MLSLVIHHNIFLTRDQRYALHVREDVECVGVAVPVWVSGATTSEPAKEVFCRYRISNTGQQIPIKLATDGFEIVMPDRQPIGPPQTITNDDWRDMTEQEKEELSSFQNPGASSLNLLDLADGGCGTLMYRENSRIVYQGGDRVNIVHLVQMRAMDLLKATCHTTPKWSEGNPSAPTKSAG